MEKKNFIPVGRGSNAHVLYGDADFNDGGRMRGFEMLSDGILRHEDMDGQPADHKTLAVEKGCWVIGRQVEFDVFAYDGMGGITEVWD